ncbi:hypothetical protein ACIP02_26410 [Pseudomonas sp. NPDC089408]|uniref:hypothetical protein n=1 Tax=Pseudomonas sp. NPDC089408 TaxID=3364465 RepID=UPI0037F38A0D
MAVIGAVKHEGFDEKAIIDKATVLLLGNNILRRVEHPHVDNAIREISNADAEVLTITSLSKG